MDPHLKISVQVFDLAGHARYGSGVLAEHEIGIPPEFTTGSEDSLFYEVDLGREYKYWVLAVRDGGAIIQVGTYSREFVRPVRQLRVVLLATVPTVFLITVFLGWWLARTSLRPLAEITATAAHITGSRLDADIPLTGSGDELDQLAQTLNDMTSRIGKSVAKLRRRGASDATVSGDISWLRQLVGNLVENACRHTPSGGRIEVEIERLNETVLVRVRDTGAGIKEEDLERVFDRFFRVPSTKAASGVGLGLTVASQIARAHGGEIRAESTVGEGSTFTVSLPSIPDSGNQQAKRARSSPTRFSA